MRRPPIRTPLLALCALLGFAALALGQVNDQLVDSATRGDSAGVRAAIAAGADVNTRTGGGLTPLILAALYGHKPVVEILLSSGARINDMDDQGAAALLYAQAARHPEMATYLEANGGKTGDIASDPIKRYLWIASQPSEIFDYLGERATEEKSKAAALLQSNWDSPLEAPTDFRGKWAFDEKASDYGRLPKPKTSIYTITQTAEQLTADVENDGTRITSTYLLNGDLSTNSVGDRGKALSTTRWLESNLVISLRLEWDGKEEAASEETWSIAPDGLTLTIDRVISKPKKAKLKQVMRKQ